MLFRGGEERDAREHFIRTGWLDAVIGLPPSLFYGTGIPACILVMNKERARERKDVLFINADREYREGRAQNFLRPEDISKIVHVYRNQLEVPGYSRLVPYAEINRLFSTNLPGHQAAQGERHECRCAADVERHPSWANS